MKIDIMATERALLGFLLAKIHNIDPDLIVVSGEKLRGISISLLLPLLWLRLFLEGHCVFFRTTENLIMGTGNPSYVTGCHFADKKRNLLLTAFERNLHLYIQYNLWKDRRHGYNYTGVF